MEFNPVCVQEIRKGAIVPQNLDEHDDVPVEASGHTRFLCLFLFWFFAQFFVADVSLWETLMTVAVHACCAGEPVQVELGGRGKSVSWEAGSFSPDATTF